ncbi:MAG: hypothetical protein BWY71_00483 [Planctomycetes bacterium ADurb.Bin412]|nr:MAG: hypothetical protein BWY71_00483 [Planctomycetes bacterium ADurb.Bin412]
MPKITKHYFIIRALVLTSILLFCAVVSHAADSVLVHLPVSETKPPQKPAYDIWIEGEAATKQTTAWSVLPREDCYNGKQFLLLTQEADPHEVIYTFQVSQAGEYLIQLAAQPVNDIWVSPMSYRLDDGDWQAIPTQNCSTQRWGLTNTLAWTNLVITNLSAAEHTLSLRADKPRPAGDGLYAFAIDAITLLHDPLQKLELPTLLTTDRVGNVFPESQPVSVRFVFPPVTSAWQWSLEDWLGQEIQQGLWTNTRDLLVLSDLPLGYYRLKVKSQNTKEWQAETTFARVVDPASRKVSPDCPYALDSCFSWTPASLYSPDNLHESLAELTRLLGVPMVRDRVSWLGTSPQPDQIDFGGYAQNDKLLARYGVNVCQVFHDSPAWVSKDRFGFPDDLVSLYRFTETAGRDFDGGVQAWEFWNEQDAPNNLPGWIFAAAQKAAYLGFKAANPDLNVLVGSNCIHPTPRFMEVMMENGAGEYFDTYNFHVYKTVGEFQGIVAEKREFLKRFGLDEKPMWVTENGCVTEGTARRDPILPGTRLREHDTQQEHMQADYLIQAQVTFQRLGVARDFFFVFKPYNEYDDGKAWGIIRWDWTVKPAYAGLATLTTLLGEAECLGRYNTGPGVDATLYQQPDGEQRLVFWSTSDAGKTFRLPMQSGDVQMTDLTGRPVKTWKAKKRLELTATGHPQYVLGLHNLRATDAPPSPRPEKAAPAMDKTIVLQIDLGNDFDVRRNSISLKNPESAAAALRINNLSSTGKQVQLKDLSDGCEVDNLSEPLTIPAMSWLEQPITVRLKTHGSGPLAFLRVEGTCSKLPISPLSVPVVPPVESLLKSLRARPLSIDAKRWIPNSSGQTAITNDAAENATRFDTQFPDAGDRWVYPAIQLTPGENLNQAVGLGFEIRCQDPPQGSALLMAVMVDNVEQGQSHYFPYFRDTQWKRVVILFASDAPASFKPKDVKMLRIGANPVIQNYTYWIRNLEVYCPNDMK